MAVELRATRKVCVIAWDTETVKGAFASIQVGGEEKRTVSNDGNTNLFFPSNFTGEIEVTVAGSREGSDSGTITVK